MSIEAEMIDKRVVRRYLERGALDANGYQRYLEQLPDCAGKCVQATPELASDDDDDDDDDIDDEDDDMQAQASAT